MQLFLALKRTLIIISNFINIIYYLSNNTFLEMNNFICIINFLQYNLKDIQYKDSINNKTSCENFII